LPEKIYINLGIDFGTRFTKVCARSEGIGATIVDHLDNGLDGALIPSVISVDDSGHLSVPDAGSPSTPENSVAYLKMALADRGQLGLNVRPELPGERSEELAEPFSAFFLATVIARAKKWVRSAWREHIGDREVVWSANVGLPVEYVDSDVAPKFQEVIAVAWEWAEDGAPTGQVREVLGDYARASAREHPQESYCQTYPEIAAAVLSFAASRNAKPGVYVYFDIGGGTVDGVVFNLIRPAGEVRINFYSGHVESLGVDWIAEDVCCRLREGDGNEHDPESVKHLLLNEASADVDAAFATYSKEISKLVGRVVYEGQRKDGRDWRKVQFQADLAHRTLRRHLNDDNVPPLRMFVGGGGNRAHFYQRSLSSAYERNTLRNYGIPPFDLVEVPAPPDLQMQSVEPYEYHRFLIAYGLSVPFGEGPDIGLPSQFEISRPPAPKRTSGLPDYSDHKDIYD
jgi:hypothetical protein